jgi:hypothetical protein
VPDGEKIANKKIPAEAEALACDRGDICEPNSPKLKTSSKAHQFQQRGDIERPESLSTPVKNFCCPNP